MSSAAQPNEKEITNVNDHNNQSMPPLGGVCALEEGSFDRCLTGKSLAMVYSPCQSFQGLHTPEEGLCRGTVFMELEKPFYGARRLK